MLERDRPALGDERKQLPYGWRIERAVEQSAPGPGDVRDDALGLLPDDFSRAIAGRDHERHHVLVLAPAGEPGVEQRHEQRLLAIPHRAPIDDPHPLQLAGLEEPALPAQERRQVVTLQQLAGRPRERERPVRSEQERSRVHCLLRGGGHRPDGHRRGRLTLQLQPVERIRAERHEVRLVGDARQLRASGHLHRDEPGVLRQVEGHRLHRPGEIGDDEHRIARIDPADEGEDAPILRTHQLDRAAAEGLDPLAQPDEPAHPVDQRERRALLGLDVHRLIAVDRIHDERRVQPRRIRAREPAVPVGRPLHRRAHAVAIAEVHVVAHADLVAVVDRRRPGQRQQQAVHQLDPAPAVLHERREAAADAEVHAHLWIGRVGLIHVVALFVGHHLERQLVVVAKEDRPLAGGRDVGRLVQDLADRMAVLLPQRHEQARHEREVKRHVAFVALAEVRRDIRGPEVGFGEQHPAGMARIQFTPELAQDVVRLRQVRARGALALDEIRHRVEPQAVDAVIEPEPHDLDHGPAHARVVEVQIGLMVEEAVPEGTAPRSDPTSSSTARCR